MFSYSVIICGIETSCDETAVSFVKAWGGLKKPRFEVLSNVVSSQVKLHAKYGGVMPMLAARKHGENIGRVFSLALKHTGKDMRPDLIAVTYGPGLMPSLLVGVNFARSFSYFSSTPLIGVNHLEGHIYSSWLEPIGVKSELQTSNDKHIAFPAMALIVSGGHTELVLMCGYGKYQLIGQTLDDAAGECFDKVARLLSLGYPGGPIIDALAKQGDATAYTFPSPMLFTKNFDFSFSGLKTSMLYFLRDHKLDFSSSTHLFDAAGNIVASKSTSVSKNKVSGGGKRWADKNKLSAKQEHMRANIAASFQHAVVKVLVSKTLKAAEKYRAKMIYVGGGVAANSRLQKGFEYATRHIPVVFPKRTYITDNAAMIAAAGYIAYQSGRRSSWKTLEPNANLSLTPIRKHD